MGCFYMNGLAECKDVSNVHLCQMHLLEKIEKLEVKLSALSYSNVLQDELQKEIKDVYMELQQIKSQIAEYRHKLTSFEIHIIGAQRTIKQEQNGFKLFCVFGSITILVGSICEFGKSLIKN